MPRVADGDAAWPPLPLDDWADTLDTLHMWTQVVGKVALALTPPANHWWAATLRVTPRGLATDSLHHGPVPVRLSFDLVDHVLVVEAGAARRRLTLEPRSVADFHGELMATLEALGTPVVIGDTPNEVAEPIPFAEDDAHASYDVAAVERFRVALVAAHRALASVRADFLGKASPAHFFWGGFDLAYTRFSGRPAPAHPGGIPHMPDWVTREAYSHELWSAGWWPGHGGFGRAAFYAYAYPEPDGFAAAPSGAEAAYYDDALREFVLPWDEVREVSDPTGAVRSFLEATYAAAADRGGWNRAAVERTPPELETLETRIHRTNRVR